MTTPTADEDDIRQQLKLTGRRYTRAREAFDRESAKLTGLVIRAHDGGIDSNADIARASDHAITPERVRQIISAYLAGKLSPDGTRRRQPRKRTTPSPAKG